MSFRYFRDPHHFSSFDGNGKVCHCCRQVRPGYDGPFYGLGEGDYVCETCLMEGELAAINQRTNEGDVRTMRIQLTAMHPKTSPEQIQDWLTERTEELECRTPSITTWQDHLWPAHCGDYCCYIKEAGKADFNDMAGDKDGDMLFDELMKRMDIDRNDHLELWGAIRPDSPADQSMPYSPGVYLFQCLICGEYIVQVDFD